MSTAPAPGRELETMSNAGPDSAPVPTTSRRELIGWAVFALVPVSVLVTLMVLHLMAAGAAAATGGCGGG
jgi:hypothetical protein